MTETSINYAKALYGLSVPGEAICETGKIFKNTPEIGKMLENPLVSLKEKRTGNRAGFSAGNEEFS